MSVKYRKVTAVVIVHDRPAPDYNYICKNIVVITREHDVFSLPAPSGIFSTELSMTYAVEKVLHNNNIKLSLYKNHRTNLYFMDQDSLNLYMLVGVKNGT